LLSTSLDMMETVKADFLTIRKGDPVSIDMWGLHHNPEEWQKPEEFIPDRFDSTSPFFLTPSGKRRNPFSFAPFLGGQRICLGKTFAETVSKITGPTLIHNFDFEFTEKKDNLDDIDLPYNNLVATSEPEFQVYISNRC